jgi:hypothetical protein
MCIASLPLAACSSNVIFLERSGFNLAVNVNDDPTTPVEVNAGLNRTIVALVPPSGGQDANKTPEGEAVNLLSGYDLQYNKSTTSALQGKLTIRTQFASGAAALAASTDAKAVAKVVTAQSGNFVYDDAAKKLRAYWKPDGTTINVQNQTALTGWMQNHGLSTDGGSITMFLYDDSALFKDARVQAVTDLKLK